MYSASKYLTVLCFYVSEAWHAARRPCCVSARIRIICLTLTNRKKDLRINWPR